MNANLTKKDVESLEESKALRQPSRPGRADEEETKSLTCQEFRYALVGIGNRRAQTDEDIQQMVMEVNINGRPIDRLSYTAMAYNLHQFATDPLEEHKGSLAPHNMEEEKFDYSDLLQGVDPEILRQLSLTRSVLSCDHPIEDVCTICQYHFDQSQTCELIVLACEHTYHKFCAINWLKEPQANMRCPVCKRHAITGEEVEADPQADLPQANPYGNTNPNRPIWLPYRCSKCKAQFNSMAGLVRHVDYYGHDTRSKFACRTCHQVYPSFTDLYNHLRQATHFSLTIRPRGQTQL